jgi:hypothetical protein
MPLYAVETHGRAVQVISAETIRDVEEDLDAWLGEDLTALEHDGLRCGTETKPMFTCGKRGRKRPPSGTHR